MVALTIRVGGRRLNMPSNKPVILGTGLSGMIGSRLVEMFGSEFEFINIPDLATGVDITC